MTLQHAATHRFIRIEKSFTVGLTQENPCLDPVCSLNIQTCRSLMHKQKKLTSMARLCLSFDVHHFEIAELAFLTLWWDFRKEASISHRFRPLVQTSSLKIDEIDKSISWSRPRSRKNEISDVSPGQRCVIHMEFSDSRISCTWNGARRSSQKVLWVTKGGYASETNTKK